MVKIIPHRHCTTCGKSIVPDEVFCSDKCKKQYDDAQKRQKLIFIAFIVLAFFLLFSSFFGLK